MPLSCFSALSFFRGYFYVCSCNSHAKRSHLRNKARPAEKSYVHCLDHQDSNVNGLLRIADLYKNESEYLLLTTKQLNINANKMLYKQNYNNEFLTNFQKDT